MSFPEVKPRDETSEKSRQMAWGEGGISLAGTYDRRNSEKKRQQYQTTDSKRTVIKMINPKKTKKGRDPGTSSRINRATNSKMLPAMTMKTPEECMAASSYPLWQCVHRQPANRSKAVGRRLAWVSPRSNLRKSRS
jgi:hypothetical protein